MRAALILCLARTRRRAIVASATRKELATCLVDRPPSRRRVSAICAWVPRAGWQQVKMRRSRSSGTSPPSRDLPGSSWPPDNTATPQRSGPASAPPPPIPSSPKSRKPTYLDRHLDGPGDPRRQAERRIQVLALDDIEAA